MLRFSNKANFYGVREPIDICNVDVDNIAISKSTETRAGRDII